MKKYILLVSAIITGVMSFAQNEFHLTQYMVHHPLINPASAGAFNTVNGALFYRSQWVGFDGAPSVAGFNINTPIGTSNSNVGLTLINDRIGVNNNTDVSANYAYKVKLSTKANLSFGLAGTLRMNQSDFSEVETAGIVDPVFQANSPTVLMPNFRFGTYYNTRKFYVGLAVPDLLHNEIVANGGGYEGETTFDFSQMHLYLHSGYKFELNTDFDLNASTLIKQVSGAPTQADLNILAVYQKKLGLGFSYRTSNEIAALAQFSFLNMFKLGYAYDFTLNDLGNYSSGSHEIMLIYQMDKGVKEPAIEAPRF